MEKMRILLVDDEDRFLRTTAKLLRRAGYEALTAGGGAEALELLAREIVSVVILDVKMPGMDGLETLDRIRALHPEVQVILLTGHATVESAVAGIRAGAFDYLMKPTGIEEMIAKAEEAWAVRRRTAERSADSPDAPLPPDRADDR